MPNKNRLFKFSIIFLGIFFFIVGVFNLPRILAQDATSSDISEMQSEIDSRNQQIAQLQAEIDAYRTKVTSTQAQADTLKSAIADLEAQKKDLENQISLTNLKIEETKENISQAENKIANSQGNISDIRQTITESLVSMKENDDMDSFVLSLFGSPTKSFSDFLDKAYKLIDFNKILQNTITSLNTNIQDLNVTKSNYQDEKDKLSSLSEDLSGREDLVLDNKDKQDSLLAETQNQESKYKEMISEKKAKVDALQSEIQDFESKIQYTLHPDELPKNGKGLFWPVDHPIIITQYFGNTPFASTGAYNGDGHSGIDIGVPVGTKIMAAAGGVVLGTGNTDLACKGASYGKWILIKHDNGLATIYGHLSKILVSAGDHVDAHQEIALSGATGYVTGPHLHFGVFASDAVKIFGPTEYKSKVCGTYMVMPYAALNAYLNPLNYLDNSQIDQRPY